MAPGARPEPSTLDRQAARLLASAHTWVLRFRNLPAPVQVLLVYGASRMAAWFIFASVALHQTSSPWKQGAMSYGEFINIWDADWYRKISERGYPSVLPLDASGQVAQNEWAFYPLYPLASRLVSQITGLDLRAAAALVSLLAGFGAAWLIYRLFLHCLAASPLGGTDPAHRQGTALWGLAAVSFSAVAPVLQTGYAEALGLLFLSWSLLYLVQGRYLLLLGPALLACLTRPVGVPLGAAAGIWWLLSWWRHYRQQRASWPPVSAAGAGLSASALQLVSALLVCFFAFIHPLHAWLVTGRADAYLATETAWRAGGEQVLPLAPWITQSQIYLGSWGPAILLLLLLAYFCLLLSPAVRHLLPLPLLVWLWAYSSYMLIFFNPQSSTFRLLLPLFPLLLPLVAASTSRAYRWLLLASGFALQYGWVGWLWHWKQLPGGGDYPP